MAEDTQKKDIILELKVNTTDAVNNIAEAKRQIADLTAAQKELAKAGQQNSAEFIRNAESIKYYNKVIALNSKEIQNNIQAEKAQSGSLKQMRADLANVTAAYDSLSKAERNGAKGKEMLDKIQNLTENLRNAEFESGRFQRNVGNYPGLFGEVGGKVNIFANAIQSITGGTKNVGSAFVNAGKSVAMFGKQLLVLLANPIVAIIAGIALVIMQVVKALKKNDDAMTQLQKAFAAFQPILNAVAKLFNILATGIANAVSAIVNFVVGSNEAVEAAQNLVQAQDDLQQAERDYTVAHAENEREISRLRTEAADKEAHTAEERKKMLKEAMDIEEADAKKAKEIAEEKLRIAQEVAAREQDTSDETKDHLAQLQAAAIQADKEYYDTKKKLLKEYNRYVKEEEAEEAEREKKRKEAAKKAAEAAKQQRNNELKETRAAKDLELALLKEGINKEEAILRENFARKIEDLKIRLKEEKNLNKTAREAINRQIILTEAQLQVEIGKLHESASEKEFSRLKAQYEMRIELAAKDIDEREKLTIQQLERERQQAIAAAAKEGQDLELVNKTYDKRINDAKKAAADERRNIVRQQAENEVAELENQYNRDLQNLNNNEQAKLELQATYAQARLERLQAEYEAVAMLNEEQAVAQYGSIEAWKAAVLNADKEVIAANGQVMQSQQAITQNQQNQALEIAKSFQSVGGSIQGIFDTLAETDERYSDFATGMALANIITSSAISIAAAIQAATQAGAFTGVAAPATIPAFIAELVGIVAAGITSAITTLNKAKQAKSQAKYAEGGVVGGEYAGREDTVSAMLTPGEFVVNRRAAQRNLPALLAINGGWGNTASGNRFAAGGVAGVDDLIRGYQADALRATVQEAVATIQPVVSVREITRVANRVQVKEQISKS